MKLIGNIIWFVLFGMIPCAIHFVLGAILCCTFVGFPAGMALFKLAKLEAFPFGKTTELKAEEPSISNILWVAFIGAGISVPYLILALILLISQNNSNNDDVIVLLALLLFIS